MSESNEPAPGARRNPLVWIALLVIGLILFVILSGKRDNAMPGSGAVTGTAVDEAAEIVTEEPVGTIERSLLVPPGMRAREYIAQLRAAGKPYPLSLVFEKAQTFQREGSLADAYLLYFFAARESHLPAVMAMAEMADPVLFRAQESLLDQADVIQAYKWYRKALELGQPDAAGRIEALRRWATAAAAAGDSTAELFLLNIQ